MDLLERLGVSPGAAIYVAAVWAIGGLDRCRQSCFFA